MLLVHEDLKLYFFVVLCVILSNILPIVRIPEEIGIDSPDEREVILSEIYRRFHPEEEDMFEMEIQGKINGLLMILRLNEKEVKKTKTTCDVSC